MTTSPMDYNVSRLSSKPAELLDAAIHLRPWLTEEQVRQTRQLVTPGAELPALTSCDDVTWTGPVRVLLVAGISLGVSVPSMLLNPVVGEGYSELVHASEIFAVRPRSRRSMMIGDLLQGMTASGRRTVVCDGFDWQDVPEDLAALIVPPVGQQVGAYPERLQARLSSALLAAL